MLHFAYPLGLLALGSLGAVVFLYFFVFRGKRIEVSSLHLWQAARSLRLEGQQKKRPPLTLPLLLELAGALLLSLLVAGLTFTREAPQRHLVVILDSSASMSAVSPQGAFRERAARKVMDYFDQLGPNGRITLVESGFEPRVLGKESLAKDDAGAVLGLWRPSGPPHPMTPALELARALSVQDAVPVLLTDHTFQLAGVRVVAVGTPLDNTGWVNCHWTGSSELFALVQHFGPGRPQKTASVYGDGRKLVESTLDFSERSAVPLAVTVPDGVSSVRLELPEDALANDNVLLTTRPAVARVPVRVDLPDEELARQVSRAIASVDRADLSDAEQPALAFASVGARSADGAFAVRFHPVPDTAASCVGPFTVNDYHPLTRGADLHGVIWVADPAFRADGLVLMSAGEIPLAVLGEGGLTLNLGARGGNVFTTPAWPVLVANVVEYVHDRAPGLKRLSFRLGETLSFSKPPSWEGTVEVETPDGERVPFDGPQVYYGRLEREGIYRIRCAGREVAAFDVNLFSEQESDLTAAASAGLDEPAQPFEVHVRAGHRFHVEFALAALAMLLCCWYLLERRAQ